MTSGDRQRIILGSVWMTVPGTLALMAVGWFVVPPLRGVEDQVGRFALAARWLVVAMLPYVAVCATIASARFLEGSHDPTKGGESPRLQIHCRVMQNTLEQLVWFGVCLLASAPLLSPSEARLVPITCVCFLVARLLYWRGYLRNDTLGRAPFVQMTFTINGCLLLLALFLFARALFV